MVNKKYDFGLISYILGIVSIVAAVFIPLFSIVLGIVGLVFSNKEKTDISTKGEKFNITGIIIGVIFLIISYFNKGIFSSISWFY
jgi:hypothetical protein